VDPVRADGAHRVGDRPLRDPVEVRRDQRLRRSRPDLRPEHGGRPACLRGDDGPARSRPRRRPGGVGHRRHLDRLAAVADRGPAPAGDPRGHAEEVRLQAAGPGRGAGQDRDSRREQRPAVQVRQARRTGHGSALRRQGRLRRPARRQEWGNRSGPSVS
jgi:hypothetical protein